MPWHNPLTCSNLGTNLGPVPGLRPPRRRSPGLRPAFLPCRARSVARRGGHLGHPRLWIAALIATLALGLGYQAYTRVDRPYLAERLPRHEAIVAGDATFPYRYRVLVPF